MVLLAGLSENMIIRVSQGNEINSLEAVKDIFISSLFCSHITSLIISFLRLFIVVLTGKSLF